MLLISVRAEAERSAIAFPDRRDSCSTGKRPMRIVLVSGVRRERCAEQAAEFAREAGS
jgi:hypothetical protein